MASCSMIFPFSPNNFLPRTDDASDSPSRYAKIPTAQNETQTEIVSVSSAHARSLRMTLISVLIHFAAQVPIHESRFSFVFTLNDTERSQNAGKGIPGQVIISGPLPFENVRLPLRRYQTFTKNVTDESVSSSKDRSYSCGRERSQRLRLQCNRPRDPSLSRASGQLAVTETCQDNCNNTNPLPPLSAQRNDSS